MRSWGFLISPRDATPIWARLVEEYDVTQSRPPLSQRERPPSSVVAPISELPVSKASSATFPSSNGLKLVSRSYFSNILRSAATTNGANSASIPVAVGTFLSAAIAVLGIANAQRPAPNETPNARREMPSEVFIPCMPVPFRCLCRAVAVRRQMLRLPGTPVNAISVPIGRRGLRPNRLVRHDAGEFRRFPRCRTSPRPARARLPAQHPRRSRQWRDPRDAAEACRWTSGRLRAWGGARLCSLPPGPDRPGLPSAGDP